MTTPLDLILPDEALALIDELGVNVTWNNRVADPISSGGVVTFSETSRVVKVSPPLPLEKVRENGFVEDNLVVYLPGQTWVPLGEDKILHEGVNYLVSSIRTFYSGDLVAVHEVRLER